MLAPETVPIAESYAFEVRVAGRERPLRVALNSVEGAGFAIGDAVVVRLERRRLCPFGSREFAIEMRLADAPEPPLPTPPAYP